jgi:putative ATP-dependent endonuclease of the OLD family
MYISRVVIKNYRCLSDSVIELNRNLNIIVGDNECGKSTFLEAVYLGLSGQLNGRSILSELHPHLFNAAAVANYINGLVNKTPAPPPFILIEIYFVDDPALARLKGKNNSKKEDVPGVKLFIEFNDDYKSEYASYIAEPALIKTVPVEYYIVRWRDFADNDITSRSIPIKPSFIDASTIRNNAAASRYVLDIVKDSLTKKQQVDLALSYRMMKDKFLADAKVEEINKSLATKKGHISDKALSLSLDTSSRANWESGIMPHLDDIPMPLVGKGEQNSVKIKLAMESSAESHIFLIEEPENHLSFSNLNILIKHIADRRGDRQLLITTHSSFVLNKLGLESVLLFSNGKSTTLKSLNPTTQDYFLKLPGYDTLRLILSKRAILVEGPSDELIVQKAFKMQHGTMPLNMGVDVITVSSLAFKRFLDIAKILETKVDVVTDNDGDVAKLKKKYEGYLTLTHVRVQFDDDEAAKTIEPQLLKSNGRAVINSIVGKSYKTDGELLKYMGDNKTECALKFFETQVAWKVPEYIARAIAQ